MNNEERIYHYANNNGIAQCGICTPEPFDEIRATLMHKNYILKGFAEQNIEKRITPTITMENVKSIVVFALKYNKKFVFGTDDVLRGNISMGAIGTDYHIVLKNKFLDLVEILKAHNKFDFKIFVDTGPLVDREVAKRANIGFIGKNGAIHSHCGSAIFIGYMMTSLELIPTNNILENYCTHCSICIKSCPTHAIKENGILIPQKCISYLTQTKNILSINEMKSMRKQLYGCDICQNACPHNKDTELFTDRDSATPSIEKILKMTNKEFQTHFGHTASGWRGKKILQRNALIVLGNTKSYKSLAILKKYENDEREVIRQTAKRAIRIHEGE